MPRTRRSAPEPAGAKNPIRSSDRALTPRAGVGEDPIIAIGPSISNAIYDAIGVRFHHYPITPEDILKALREKGQ